MAKTKRKPGRPPGGEFSDKSEVMHHRIQRTTKALLEKAAAASGRPVSQEVEHRLLLGLDEVNDDPIIKMLYFVLSDAIRRRYPHAVDRWWTDPDLAEGAKRTLAALIDMYSLGTTPPMGDVFTYDAAAVARRVQLADETKPYKHQTRAQVWFSTLRKELGDLADRPVVWGKSAEEWRKEHAELDAIRSLRQKSAPLESIPESDRTPEQKRKLERLQHQMREIAGRKPL